MIKIRRFLGIQSSELELLKARIESCERHISVAKKRVNELKASLKQTAEVGADLTTGSEKEKQWDTLAQKTYRENNLWLT